MAKRLKIRLPNINLVLFILLLVLILAAYQAFLIDKFAAKVFIGDQNISFLERDQAYRLINATFSQRSSQTIKSSIRQQSFTLDLSSSSASLNYSDALDQAFAIGHQGTLAEKLMAQVKTLFLSSIITPQVNLYLDGQIEAVAQKVVQPPQNASLIVNFEATPAADIKTTASADGLELDKEKLLKAVKDYLVFGKEPTDLPIKESKPQVTSEKVTQAKMLLGDLLGQPIKLNFGSKTWIIDGKTAFSLVNLQTIDQQPFDQVKLADYLKKVAAEIDQPVVEALFNFDPGTKRVSAFKPSQEGRQLDQTKTATLIILAADRQRSKNITLPVEIIAPKINTPSANNLGIKELLGRGTSHFSGSIPNRIYNIGLAASRINGVLILPREIFSFNDKVGDISAASGYKQAYVIKSGRTVLDDGGGVCQDSTTLFRAVLNAGLPVVARTAHAYRVGYYEQGFPPGLDATVFAPSVDFKFKNDTPAHVLIQAYTTGTSLYVDLYGTSDGRVSQLSTPLVTNQTPPPAELRQDDSTLPKGEVKQVDFPAWGADVSFKRTVTRDGQVIINEVWRSNFKPWQAIYLVGTKEN